MASPKRESSGGKWISSMFSLRLLFSLKRRERERIRNQTKKPRGKKNKREKEWKREKRKISIYI